MNSVTKHNVFCNFLVMEMCSSRNVAHRLIRDYIACNVVYLPCTSYLLIKTVDVGGFLNSYGDMNCMIFAKS
jgi:hypothetical protein